jgi:hypothetical protein
VFPVNHVGKTMALDLLSFKIGELLRRNRTGLRDKGGRKAEHGNGGNAKESHERGF